MECGAMTMKIDNENESTYMQSLTHTLYRKYCDCVDIFGDSSEVAVILYKALLDCMKYCDKYDIDYHLNYDND